MRTSFRTLTTLAAAVTTATLLAAAPAQAESVDLTDLPGSAPDFLDVTSASIDNGERRLRGEINLRRFDRDRTSAYLLVNGTGAHRDDTFVVGWSQVRGERQGRVFVKLTADGFEPVRCQGARIGLGRRTVDVSVPQRCLGETAGTLRVGVLTERPGGRDADTVGPERLRRG